MDYTHYTPMRVLKPTLLSLILGGILAMPFSAQAGSITNLSDEPQTIEVKAEGYEPYVIQPNRSFTFTSNSTIKFRDSEFHIQDNINYAIWPDGNIGPQGQAGRGRR